MTAPKRRWFRLSAALVVVLIVAVGGFAGHWGLRYNDARAARLHYESVLRAHHADAVIDTYVYNASEELLDAELRVPFSNPRAVTSAHVKRIESIRDDFIRIMPGYDRDGEGRLAVLNQLCAEANERLSQVK